ncbi:MAG: hypothetical protein OEV92_12950, partial [Nitrospinota bacterium]|nr:hypothetical protein [Nitrospinota bacterium]
SFRVEGRQAQAIGFKMAWFFHGFDWKHTSLDMVYTPEINYWADAERLRLRVIDIRKSQRD